MRYGDPGFRNRENAGTRRQAISAVRALLLLDCVARTLDGRVREYLLATATISLVLCLAVDTAFPREGSYDRSPYGPSDVETVSGRVARVETLAHAGGRGRDITVVLETGIGDEVRVAIAPQWVSNAMGLRLRAGDQIRVTGWRIVRGKPALLAAEIGKGVQVFVFRDRHGVPMWGPGRRLRSRPTHRVDQPDQEAP